VNTEPNLVALDATIVELFEPQKFIAVEENSAAAGEKFSLPNFALTQIQLIIPAASHNTLSRNGQTAARQTGDS
jgi:hypothetical protein